MAKTISGNRLQGGLPKIGIRPAIDGRRKGVRESLENQTMDQAKLAARLITENLRHPSGEKVECVIADTCIGGFAESARTAEKFAGQASAPSLTVTPCWCYGSETMDMDPLRPKAVWGFNGTERPGAVYLAAVLAGHTQKGLPAFGIYGRDVQEANDKTIPADVQQKLLQFAKSALAVGTMRNKSYLALGGISMGIAGSIVNPDFLESYLGMAYEGVDMSEFIRRIDEEIYDKEEFKRALRWVKENCREGKDYNRPPLTKEKKDKDWEFVVKLALMCATSWSAIPNWKNWGLARRRSAIMPSPRDFRASGSGRTTSRMAISSKPCSTPLLTGTAFANPTSLPRKTTS